MKTNQKQKGVCDFIIEQVKSWKDSNDSDSYEHETDFRNGIDRIVEEEGWLDEEQADELNVLLLDTLYLITNIKEDEND